MIDLNQARKKRAAERESNGEAPTITLEDKTFRLPPELPFQAVEHVTAIAAASGGDPENFDPKDAAIVNQATSGFVRALLGPGFEAFMAMQPSSADIQALIEGVLEEYGLSPGEAQASEGS